MARTLYELDIVESPFVWRSKYALAHKGLDYESRRTAFTDIPSVCGGKHKTVPILVDENGTETCDSLAIATYLDETYSDQAPLFDNGDKARTEEIEGLLGQYGLKGFFPLYIHDIWSSLPEKDATYFRKSREERFSAKLEDMCANREERLPASRAGLATLHDALGGKQWFSGDAPAYPDYVVLAFFAFLKGCAKIPPLAADDPFVDYINRGFALYGGIGEKITGGPIAA